MMLVKKMSDHSLMTLYDRRTRALCYDQRYMVCMYDVVSRPCSFSYKFRSV